MFTIIRDSFLFLLALCFITFAASTLAQASQIKIVESSADQDRAAEIQACIDEIDAQYRDENDSLEISAKEYYAMKAECRKQ